MLIHILLAILIYCIIYSAIRLSLDLKKEIEKTDNYLLSLHSRVIELEAKTKSKPSVRLVSNRKSKK